MRYVKTTGIAAIAAVAAMAFAVNASATSLTSGEGTYTSTIVAQAGEVTLHGVVTITCNASQGEGVVKLHGESTTASGEITEWSFSECGENHTTVERKGSLIIHTKEGGSNGILTATETEVKTRITSLGFDCVFTTENTELGTLTGSTSTNAVLDIESASIPRTGGSIFCGSSAVLTGTYTVTTPSTLYVD